MKGVTSISTDVFTNATLTMHNLANEAYLNQSIDISKLGHTLSVGDSWHGKIHLNH